MSNSRPNSGPPRLARFVLRHFAARYQRDALIGDLIEEHAAGRSSAWLWWQVLCAVGSNVQLTLRKRRPAVLALAAWWGILIFLTFALRLPVVLFALDPSPYYLLHRRRRRREAARRMAAQALLVCLCLVCGLPRPAAAAAGGDVKSGERVLHGLIDKPAGRGPCPAVLYDPGPAPGPLLSEAFERSAPDQQARRCAAVPPGRQ